MHRNLYEIEIEHQCYCPDQGMFCRFLDRRTGYCVATSCERGQEILYNIEMDKRAKAAMEAETGWLEISDMLYEKALEQLERLGGPMIDLDICEEDLKDLHAYKEEEKK